MVVPARVLGGAHARPAWDGRLVAARSSGWLVAVHFAHDAEQRRRYEYERQDQRGRAKSHNSPSIHAYSPTRRSLRAFPITDTELTVIAALAIIGLSNSPNQGYRMPAATGTPAIL